MRIYNRTHIVWFLFVVLATIVVCWVYIGNFYPARLPTSLELPSALVQKVSEHRSIGGTPVGLRGALRAPSPTRGVRSATRFTLA